MPILIDCDQEGVNKLDVFMLIGGRCVSSRPKSTWFIGIEG